MGGWFVIFISPSASALHVEHLVSLWLGYCDPNHRSSGASLGTQYQKGQNSALLSDLASIGTWWTIHHFLMETHRVLFKLTNFLASPCVLKRRMSLHGTYNICFITMIRVHVLHYLCSCQVLNDFMLHTPLVCPPMTWTSGCLACLADLDMVLDAKTPYRLQFTPWCIFFRSQLYIWEKYAGWHWLRAGWLMAETIAGGISSQ